MRCQRCAGLVIESHGARHCCNCSWDPDLVLITVKCSTADCRMLPELNGYCLSCWHSRKRSELSEAERSKRYRDRMRGYQRVRRAKEKELRHATSLHDSLNELPGAERDYQGGKGAPDGLQQYEEAMGRGGDDLHQEGEVEAYAWASTDSLYMGGENTQTRPR